MDRRLRRHRRAPRASLLAVAASFACPLAQAASPAVRRARAECDPAAAPRGGCVVRLDVAPPASSEDAPATAWAAYAAAGAGGWPQLEVATRSAADGAPGRNLEHEAFAAGLVEGALTCQDVADYWYNVRTATASQSADALRFVVEQDHFVRSEARKRSADDDYWLAVAMVLAQFDGLLHGHNLFCPGQPLTHYDLLILNLDGDLFDIMAAFPAYDVSAEWLNSSLAKPRMLNHRRALRCSALFKLLPDGSDVLFGHDTWDTYAVAGPRMFKSYTLPVRRYGRVEKHVDVFSSSPGYLSSIDDYYMISGTAALVVIETSLDVANKALYDLLTPRTVPCWLRVMASNMLAHTPAEWAARFSEFHSGTYNNQWMVLDVGAFHARGLGTGLFWVLEELPGTIVAEDMSDWLRSHSYWASYNIAFFPKIRSLSQDHTKDAREELFRELQAGVTSMESMQYVMGWNDYRHSKISKGDPYNAIMARGDFVGEDFGGIDSKVSSGSLYRAGMATFARVGPTNDELPPFCWNATDADARHLARRTPHRGQPDCFDFSWERIWLGRVVHMAEEATAQILL